MSYLGKYGLLLDMWSDRHGGKSENAAVQFMKLIIIFITKISDNVTKRRITVMTERFGNITNH